MARKNKDIFPLGYRPYWADQINLVNSYITPTTVKYADSAAYAFWLRSFYERLLSTIDFQLPKEWQGEISDFFKWCLVTCGYVAVFDTEEFGLAFQPGSLGGYSFYYQPTYILISNPKFNQRLEIHQDCELLKMTPDYLGLWDIINRFALECSLMDPGINMSLINNKYAKMFFAKDKAAAETIKKAMDLINRGEPGIVLDDELADDRNKEAPFQFWIDEDLKKKYITTDQLQDLQTIINQFDAEIGSPTVPDQKKERIVTKEATSKEADSRARCTTWLRCLESSKEQIIKMFPRLENELNFTLTYPEEDPEEDPDDQEVDENDG